MDNAPHAHPVLTGTSGRGSAPNHTGPHQPGGLGDSTEPNRHTRRIRPARPTAAVIGAGVSGLTAAYVLPAPTTSPSSRPRTGSAATRTPTTSARRDGSLRVDSGFIVHNERTYPHLLRLFGELDVPTRPTEMSMSITCEGCGLSYAGGRGLRGMFAQPRRLVDPRFVRMLRQVQRFHRPRTALLARRDAGPRPTASSWPREGFSDYFVAPLRHPARLLRVVVRRPDASCTTRPATCSGSSTTTACYG